MSEVDVARREEWLSKAGILTEALPFMRRYNGKRVVVKYGGHAMGDAALAQAFAEDMVLMKQVGMHPLVVHGGGPQIGRMLERLAIKSEFIDGLRVTDKATVEIVEMVLAGSINKGIVASINAAGGRAVGISGKDAGLITARKVSRTKTDPDSNIEKVLDLGFVGEPDAVDPAILETLSAGGIIPVVAPIGLGPDGETYNINADTSAGAIAAASRAARFVLLTDVEGVLDRDGKLIEELTVSEAKGLIKDGTVSGGMIPKIETCIQAVEQGSGAAVILDGRVQRAVLLELFTPHGVGTLIRGA
ncbi:MAG: acetylglutamate kinase [Rhodospirillaceae bacterium]|jgi:acetylglutamate kinase|nr:acetylglutamate kinase [Rhodospirillaceae bacterium]MBT6139712.1 acetylglutamate kinase [Rhodospirillaceae bacterium]